jgi:Fe-S-cluster containining protein
MDRRLLKMMASILSCHLVLISLGLVGAFIQHRILNENSASRLFLSTTVAAETTGKSVWWQSGLKFGCTACGRCCQNDGEVWLDADEFCDLTSHLKLPPAVVLEKYSEKVMSGWVKLKNKVSDKASESDRCIFLDDDGKKCTVYEARPVQCRTYPWWPRLLLNESEWQTEVLL